jgi:guanylate kinase
MSPHIIVLIGPSGAGKSTIAELLCNEYGFELVKTVTTRPQRDASDIDQTFVDNETFQAMLESKTFFGTLEAFGYSYGLPKFNPKNQTVLLLRAPAVKEFLTGFPNAHIIELDAPLSVLEERLLARGSAERFDTESLTKEIAFGRTLATHAFDTSAETPEAITASIAKL